MSEWIIQYEAAAQDEYDRLDGSVRKQVFKAMEKVRQNPLPISEGGYGKPLGNRGGRNLTGLLKIKLRRLGLRVVYRLVRTGGVMKVIVVSVRSDEEVYALAVRRMGKA